MASKRKQRFFCRRGRDDDGCPTIDVSERGTGRFDRNLNVYVAHVHAYSQERERARFIANAVVRALYAWQRKQREFRELGKGG